MIVKKFQEVPNEKVSYVFVEKNIDIIVDFIDIKDRVLTQVIS